MASPRQGLERFLEALEGAGLRPVARRGTYPCMIELHDLETGEPPQPYAIYLRLLRPGGHGRGESSMRVWVPPRLPIGAPGGRPYPLVLGYDPELDVFAGWLLHDPRWARLPKRLWVPRRSLLEAAKGGFARPDTPSMALAFRPDAARFYLDFVRVAGPSHFLADPLPPFGAGQEYRRYEEADSGGAGYDAIDDAVEDEVEIEVWPRSRFFERPAKEVESGFAPAGRPAERLTAGEPLAPGGKYVYWFAIGAELGDSIEAEPAPPPPDLPDRAALTVQLYPFEDELQLTGPTRGELELLADGAARVLSKPGVVDAPPELRDLVLFFPVRARKRFGAQRLRCNLYHGSTLLQSRLVTCRVGGKTDPEQPALRSDLDYALAPAVDAAGLAELPEHDLCLMVNGGGEDGDPAAPKHHQFRFFRGGEERFASSASLDAAKLSRAIGAVRGALRLASWNSEAEWDGDVDSYLYGESPGGAAQFAKDLTRMAIRGHRLYVDITRELAEGSAGRKELREAMREPGRIQIAAPRSGLYVPAALFYDHPLEASPSPQSMGKFKLCADFMAALDGPEPLEHAACVNGCCPQYKNRFVVCPSGFWGYRHEIGWPVGGKELPRSAIECDGRAELAIGVTTDPRLEGREAHVKTVLAMGTGTAVESRDEFRDLVKPVGPHLAYLYCHGGLSSAEGAPYLVLGPLESAGLDGTYLVDEEIEWGEPPPRPIVFINGCHTTALEPAQLLDLVDGFVKDAGALGVLGAEVTIFEPLARAFAEQMLERFLIDRATLGAAIRRTRFELLRARNPLGLVYVPFIAPDTRLVSA